MIRKKKGMALPMVIVIMLVVTILGITLMQIGVAQAKQAAVDKSRMQAYYLAKSGVEATKKWLSIPQNNINDILGKTSASQSLTGSGVDGTYVVEVSGSTESLILVKGTGTVKNVSATATMILKGNQVNYTWPVFDDTVYAKTIVVISGNTIINGTVGAGLKIDENGKSLSTGGKRIITKTLPPPIMPANPSQESTPSYKDNMTLPIAGMPSNMLVVKKFYYNSNKKTITINTGSIGDVVRIVAEEFDFQNGTLALTGSGRLEIYVTKLMQLAGEINPGGSAKRLMVFLDTGAKFSIVGNPVFCGVIYGPEASNVELGGTGGFTGAVIAGTATLYGTPFAGSGNAGDIKWEDLPISVFSDASWVNG